MRTKAPKTNPGAGDSRLGVWGTGDGMNWMQTCKTAQVREDQPMPIKEMTLEMTLTSQSRISSFRKSDHLRGANRHQNRRSKPQSISHGS
jgi:hypothetical protein